MMRLALSALLLTASTFAASDEFCPTVYSDLHRRQLAHFSSDGVFDINNGAKHVPVLTLGEDGNTATVVVGNGDVEGGVWHPMVASDDPETVHFVTHILLKDQDDNVVALQPMDPTSALPATATFEIPDGVTELTPYEFCNIHGLYVGETVALPITSQSRNANAECDAIDFPEAAWESVHADFVRQQNETYLSDTPFTEADGEKHTPYITLADDGKSLSIFVGKEPDPIHPMNGSVDGVTEPHWITELYVVDQNDKILTMKSLDPTGVDAATLDFVVPEGTESVTAYSWCNIHGLWIGPTVEIPATVAVADADTPSSSIPAAESKDSSSSSTTGANIGLAAGGGLGLVFYLMIGAM